MPMATTIMMLCDGNKKKPEFSAEPERHNILVKRPTDFNLKRHKYTPENKNLEGKQVDSHAGRSIQATLELVSHLCLPAQLACYPCCLSYYTSILVGI